MRSEAQENAELNCDQNRTVLNKRAVRARQRLEIGRNVDTAGQRNHLQGKTKISKAVS